MELLHFGPDSIPRQTGRFGIVSMWSEAALSFSTFFLTCVNAGGVSNAFQTRAPASAPFGLTLQTFLAQSVVVQHLLCEDGFQVHCKLFNGPLG